MALRDDEFYYPQQQIPFMGMVGGRKLEKGFMNPIRYRTNYQIVPAYAVLCAVCLGLGIFLMDMDSQRFLPVFILLFAVMGVASVWLLLEVPKTRKQELALEEERYDLSASDVVRKDAYEIPYDGHRVVLKEDGIWVNDSVFEYDKIAPTLVTSNYCNRVWLAIRFGTNPETAVYAPLSPEVMQAIHQFRIPISNDPALIYLRTHKTNAFAQIYHYGTFHVF